MGKTLIAVSRESRLMNKSIKLRMEALSKVAIQEGQEVPTVPRDLEASMKQLARRGKLGNLTGHSHRTLNSVK